MQFDYNTVYIRGEALNFFLVSMCRAGFQK